MRVLVTVWAWPSHYYPLVPLAWALRSAGHEVQVASQPALAPVIERSGMHPVAIGRDVDYTALVSRHVGQMPRLSSSRGWWDAARQGGAAEGSFTAFAAVAEAMAGDLIDLTRSYRPDLIVHDATTFAAPLAAAAAGVPAIRQLWGPDLMIRFTEAAATALEPVGRRHGLSRIDLAAAATLDPCPRSLQVPTSDHRLWTRYIPYNGSGAVPAWLGAPPVGRPRIAVTGGTTSTLLAGEERFLAQDVIEALEGVDCELVAAVSPGDRERLANVPANTRLAESLPLSLLLPTCDLLIHQGGGGTILTALTYGVPQLVIPQLPDHAFNGRQLSRTGACIVLYPAEMTVDDVRQATAALLGEPSYRAAAGRLCAEMAARPSPAQIIGAMADIADGRSAAIPACGAGTQAGAVPPAFRSES